MILVTTLDFSELKHNSESYLLRMKYIYLAHYFILFFFLNLLCLIEILDEGDSDSNTDQDAGSSDEEEEEEEEEDGEENEEGKSYSNNSINALELNYF
jgi:hypothetical protein